MFLFVFVVRTVRAVRVRVRCSDAKRVHVRQTMFGSSPVYYTYTDYTYTDYKYIYIYIDITLVELSPDPFFLKFEMWRT